MYQRTVTLLGFAAAMMAGCTQSSVEDDVHDQASGIRDGVTATIAGVVSLRDPMAMPFCTAAKVAGNRLLTAGHCLTSSDGGPYARATGLRPEFVGPQAHITISTVAQPDLSTIDAEHDFPEYAELEALMARCGPAEGEEDPACAAGTPPGLAGPTAPPGQAFLRIMDLLDKLVAWTAAQAAPHVGLIDLPLAAATVHPDFLPLAKGNNWSSSRVAPDVGLLTVDYARLTPQARIAWDKLPAVEIATSPVQPGSPVGYVGFGGQDGEGGMLLPDVTRSLLATQGPSLRRAVGAVVPQTDRRLAASLAGLSCLDSEGKRTADYERTSFFVPAVNSRGKYLTEHGDSGGMAFRRRAADSALEIVGVISGTVGEKIECDTPGHVPADFWTPENPTHSVFTGLSGIRDLIGPPVTERPSCTGWGGRCVMHQGVSTYVYCANGKAASFFATTHCQELLNR